MEKGYYLKRIIRSIISIFIVITVVFVLVYSLVPRDRIFNADAVGAYNILRLYFQKTEKTAIGYTNLSSLNKVTV